ncbi:hypothetical protein [Sphingomonas sp. 37zxx]|uniref:hypothetical protein n=1 Tax=Sphingomonas sp. 37zxx TaxID=1550073 RepID=UPI00053BE2E8|nr:hypothetical protein [Sphingomonas sp. 37zxx]
MSVFAKNLFDFRLFTNAAHNALLTTAKITPNNLTGFLPKNAFRFSVSISDTASDAARLGMRRGKRRRTSP